MNWAEITVGGLWFLAAIVICLGVWNLHIAHRHWVEADKIMREIVFKTIDKAMQDMKKDRE